MPCGGRHRLVAKPRLRRNAGPGEDARPAGRGRARSPQRGREDLPFAAFHVEGPLVSLRPVIQNAGPDHIVVLQHQAAPQFVVFRVEPHQQRRKVQRAPADSAGQLSTGALEPDARIAGLVPSPDLTKKPCVSGGLPGQVQQGRMDDGVGPRGIDPVLAQNGFHKRLVSVSEVAVRGDIIPLDVEFGHVHKDFVDSGEVLRRRNGPIRRQPDQYALHLVAGRLFAVDAAIGLAHVPSLALLHPEAVDIPERPERAPADFQDSGIAIAPVPETQGAEIPGRVRGRILPGPPDVHRRHSDLGLRLSLEVPVAVRAAVVIG